MKLRSRMLLNILGLVTLMIVLIVVLIGFQTRNNMTEIGNNLVKEQAEKLASNVQSELNVAMDTARSLSYSFAGMREIGDLERSTVNLILRNVLEENDQFYAVWSAWEPNAFDGKDELYALSEGTDETGRFISYWYRNGEQLSLQALENYDVPGEGDYYLLARNSGQDTVLDPYEYDFGGQRVLTTSLVSPIKVNGQVVGAVGIDVTMNELQEMMSKVSLYDTGYAFIVSQNATIVTNPDTSIIGQNLTNWLEGEQLRAVQSVLSGEESEQIEYVMDSERFVIVYEPIHIGSQYWSVATSVPVKEMTA